jgi:cell division transport system permease protein
MKKVRTSKFFNSGFTATISISLVLFLVGIISFLTVLTHSFSKQVKEDIGFTITLTDSITGSELTAIQKHLKSAPYTKIAKYISKDQALKEFSDEMGENPERFLGYNPLSASYEVKINADYSNEASISLIQKEITKLSGVKDFIYQKSLIELVNKNIQSITLFLSIIAIILLLVSIGIINTTIRLQIYSKRFTINTMKLVGATPWFIRKPFLKRNFISGLLSFLIAVVFLGALIYYIQEYHITSMNLYQPEFIGFIAGSMLLLDILIVLFSSVFAIEKYLRIKTNDLYYI